MDIKKQLHTWGKLESEPWCPGKDMGETWKDLKFIPQADHQHRGGLQESEKQKQYQKGKNDREGRESNLQSYHIIRCKCLFFNNNKNHKEIGKNNIKDQNRKLWHNQRKKINQQKLSLKKLWRQIY